MQQAQARPSEANLLIVLGVLVIAAALTSLMLGSAHLPLPSVIRGLFGAADTSTDAIVRDIRLPRVLLSLLVGGVLGLSGAALQGYMHNPLAEPATLGLSNSAALGAVIALYFGYAAQSQWALPLFAIATALVAMFLLMGLIRYSDGTLTLILGGIAIGTLSGAAISLALNLSPNPFAAMEMTFWMLGSVEDRTMQQVLLVVPFVTAGAGLLLWDRRALDALSLGEETAQSLGFNLKRIEMRLMIAIALGIGACVAVSGSIAFVGLVVPHILRPWTDGKPSRLLLPSAVAGAALLTAADILVRIIPTTNELRLGVVTAFLGTPFFLHLLLRRRTNRLT